MVCQKFPEFHDYWFNVNIDFYGRYCTKWSRVSIQRQQHRNVGVFLCNYDNMENEQERKKRKVEIREAIIKIKKQRLDDLDIESKLDWCKAMCLTLQSFMDGHWVVMVGHRAQYRSFHSVILENQDDTMNNNMGNNGYEQQVVQKVPLKVNLKTDAEFINFGLGPSWFNWSVIVAKIE